MSETQARYRLLVVDDEVEICNFVKSFFECRGFRVFQAYDGDDAVLQATRENPHVVLLDVRMKRPEEGLETLPRIVEAVKGVKVVLTTAVDDDESRERARAHGAVDYVTKPLVLEDLEAMVMKQVRGG
ncbi:MAG: response regulator [Candidatus Omnitrophica bacterium]|nr:response regulator [Candidatus Omnitrophota bacterium]